MTCANCGATIGENEARCPRCAAARPDAAPRGSAILRPQAVGADAPSRQEPTLVDHEHTMRRLRAAWRAARGGQGHLVSLVGENGSGRSRLIRELGRTIDEEAPDARWLIGRAHSSATYLPFHLLADLLAPWSGETLDTDAATQLATALIALAEGAEPEERRALLGLAREVRDTTERDDLVKLPLAERLAAALRRVVGDAPLVIVLEDLEWGDAASLAVLDALLPPLLRGSALIIYTHHADWSHEWPDIARHSQLYLGTLSRPESARLVAEIAAGHELTPAIVEALIIGGHGNPLLIEQATLATVEGGLTEPALVPTNLLAAIRARIACLPDEARDVLLASALLGQRFAYRAIAMVTESSSSSPRALDEALRELSARGFVVRWRDGREVTYRFTHALIQEAAYGRLRRADRQLLEARVADWLLTEGALRQRKVATILEELDALIAQARATEAAPTPEARPEPDAVIEAAPTAALAAKVPTQILPRNDKRRAEVLARIVLADLPADQRATLALCLEHGYTYDQASETLGLPRETIRDHLFGARMMFKRLQDASEFVPSDEPTEVAR